MKSKHFVAIIFCLTLVLSCKKESIPQDADNLFTFRDYINYTSSGLQSVTQPITVNLRNDIENWKNIQELETDILSIYPHVEGTIKAVDKHTLVFTPDEHLEPSTEYKVKVKLDGIYKTMPKDYKDFVFQFKTITPNFNINTNALQSYSKHWQYIEAVLTSADVISLKDAKSLVEVSQNGKKLKIEFDGINAFSNQFEFRIDSINRLVEDSEILVKWNGKPIQSDNTGENNIPIPGINNFKIINIQTFKTPEQFLYINFSDPIKNEQNFDGLVSIEGVRKPKFAVIGNVLKVYPDKPLIGDIKVDVFKGIKNNAGYTLKTPFSEDISFEDIKPMVRLIGNGTILPNSNNLKFNFEAVNLSAVDVRVIKIFEDNILQFLQDNPLNSNNKNNIKRVGRRIAKQTIQLQSAAENSGQWEAYSIDLSNFFKADAGAIYRIEIDYNKNYSLYHCQGEQNELSTDKNDAYQHEYTTLSAIDNNLKEEEYWDNRAYRYRTHSYNWRQRDNPCNKAYYSENRMIAQNLVGSNLGVIAKKDMDNTYYFAVTNILNTNPEANATIKLYNFQRQEIGNITTNKEGLATYKANKYASFAIATKNNNTSYIKLSDGHALSLSKFDVSGQKLQRGIKGYIYGERGVWRPGDSLFLTFILNDKENSLPKGHPVKMEITDPYGKLVYTHITTDNVNNFYKFIVPTSTDGKTGNYNAKVSVGGAQFHKGLKIETVKPNRLKIKIDFKNEILSNTNPIEGALEVKWLHGAPAKQIKTEVKAKFSASKANFKNYKDYIFNDPTRQFNTEELNVFSGTLNANGQALINTKLDIGKNAPGMLNAQFLVRAFENGGDFSLDAFTKPYSPFTSYVGLKSPKGNRYGSYFTDTDQLFELVVVNKDGQPIKRNNLEIKIYKVEWRWWWNSSYDNLSNYVSSNYHRPILDQKVSTKANGKTTFTLKIPENERGRYLIRIYDPVSGHATGRTAYFYKDWSGMSTKNNKEAAKMLVFTSNKTQYNVGDTAEIKFPSGSEGRALVSIENGSDVIDFKWVNTKKGETTVTVPITSEMAPNVFVNISLLQPHDITSNDLPIRLYGVIPILVEDPKTILQPELQMVNVLRPKEEFQVFISEKNNKPMTYTIAMVEEGLLDLTRFKTPNPWSEFYSREALGIKTWDIFDDVIGAYSGSIDQVFAIGGDGSASKGKNKKANRFKPVVTYLGPFELKTGQKRSHNIKVPNYIGAVRTMVIAGHKENEAYGRTEKSVEVKKPLMVLATLPRQLSPGEKVTLPVTVFAMEPNVKHVTLSLKLSSGISVIGSSTKQLTFVKPDEQMAFFELDVSKAKGVSTVEVIATGNGEKSTYKVELNVTNPNPITSKYETLTLEGNTSNRLEFSTFGDPGTNTAIVEFSTLPPMDFSKRLQYLIRYPHGCVEQTTSSVFPQLFLNDILDLKYEEKLKIQANIKQGIKRLGSFQRPNGGLSYWIGENDTNDWGTSYAGHFMIEAESKGFVLPLTFKTNWLRYQKQAARNWRPSYRNHNSDLAQAYRLYTLALSGQPDLGAMNRLKEFSELSNEARWRLAAAYALAGQKEASKQLASLANINFKSKKHTDYTYGSADRNRAMALETMIITNDDKARDIAEQIAKDLSSSQWMSTQTTAYSLLAMAKLVQANGGKDMSLTYTFNGNTETITTKSSIAQRTLLVNEGANSLQLDNKVDAIVYIRVLNSGQLPLGKELTVQRGLGVSVVYQDLQGHRLDIKQLQQGQDIIAKIIIDNKEPHPIRDVALTQIFPSGWEIVNTRFTDFGDTTTSQARHTDIRDDRVNFYFNIGGSGSNTGKKVFTVMLNAAYLGTYYLPGTQAEAMYDNDFFVRNKGQWIEVIK